MKIHRLPQDIIDLVTEASVADTYEERLVPIKRLCRKLHNNSVLLERVCEHFFFHYEDEFELDTVLLVLHRMLGELDMPIVRLLTKGICSSRITIHDKTDMIFILSQLVNCAPIHVYRRIMRLQSVEIKIATYDEIIGQIHIAMCLEKAIKLIKLCLKFSSHKSKRVRFYLLSPFITFDRSFSDERSRIYDYCLNKVRLPHHKVLLYLGLRVACPERAKAYADKVPSWAKASALARWYLQHYEEIRED